jgi:putative endonuclease
VTDAPGNRSARGRAAEEGACRYLEGKGFAVVERNYRSGDGEIDIVARKGDLLVFVEVRFREDGAFGSPEGTVGPRKRRRVVAAARRYLSKVSPGSWGEARFDVIAIEGSGETAVLRHYPSAFDAKGNVL